MQKTTTKYVTNKQLLAEIHKSKNTYCYFLEPKHALYDAIVSDVSKINKEFAEKVLEKKLNQRKKDLETPPKGIDDLVFRVMTYEHVPLCGDKKKRSRALTGEGHLRTNFPPFKHYMLKDDGEVVEVGRSHWRYGFDNGEFCLDHGKINDRLAGMFMLLVERYSRRSNWRGYCFRDDTEAFTQRGWLKHDEINESDIILSYNNNKLTWSSIKSIFRDENYNSKMFHLTGRTMDACITPGHKFVTQTNTNGVIKETLKEVDYLNSSDKIVLMGDAVNAPNDSIYSNEFVELIGWIITEGNYYSCKTRKYTRVSIFQNEGKYADRIRDCLKVVATGFSEYHRTRDNKTQIQICFHLRKNLCEKILEVMPARIPTMKFLLSLSQEQRKLLINTMIDGDGVRTKNNTVVYSQKSKEGIDFFISLCSLAGLRTSTRQLDIVSFGKPTKIYKTTILSHKSNKVIAKNIDFHGGKKDGSLENPNQPTVDYKGTVWCPETEYGSLLVRRNGYVYLSGNSYVEEMRSSALLQLSQIGLLFDESKGDNPFAFYTTTIKNAFTRVFNVERKNQNIRDDMLIIAGASPSYTKQVENEMMYRTSLSPAPQEARVEASKRGRKAKVKVISTDDPSE